MITPTYTVTFPNVVRPKYEEEAKEALTLMFEGYEVEVGDGWFDKVYTCKGFSVAGIEDLKEAKNIFLQMKDYFLNVGNFQLTNQDIQELTDYAEGLDL